MHSGLFAFLIVATASAQADPARWRDLAHTDTRFELEEPVSAMAWRMRADHLREQVRWAAGLRPALPRTPLRPVVTEPVRGDGYTVQGVYFESAPGLFVTGNLYRPTGRDGRRPAVACPHGHWSRGRLHHDDRGSVPARCITLARLGAVVFAWDMLGYSDHALFLQHREPVLLEPANALWGIGPLQLQTWNSIRVLDFLQSLPDVDPDRIGVTGASGGGTQTFLLAAVDDRVRIAAPVNMVSALMQGGCACENAPGLRIEANNVEIAALCAPRPLLLVSASGDWTRETPERELPFVRAVYGLLDAGDRIAHAHFDAPHNYNRDSRIAMYRFFGRHLLGEPAPDEIDEGDIELPDPSALQVLVERPGEVSEPDELVRSLRDTLEERLAAMPHEEVVDLARDCLRHAVASNFPAREAVEVDGERFRRGSRSVPWRALGATPAETERTLLLVDGADLARPLLRPGVRIVLLEPFGTGSNTVPDDAPARGSTLFFTTFHRTDHAEAVFDVVTALAVLLRQGHPVDLVGAGSSGAVVLAARALVPGPLAREARLRTAVELSGFDPNEDESYLRDLELPNVRRAGGLRALVMAVADDGPLLLCGVQSGILSPSRAGGATVEEGALGPVLSAWLRR